MGELCNFMNMFPECVSTWKDQSGPQALSAHGLLVPVVLRAHGLVVSI